MSGESQEGAPLIEVRDLRVDYETRRGPFGGRREVVQAVRGVSFEARRGRTVGLVGESGSGKSTVGKAILKLAPISGGRIFCEGAEVGHLSEKQFLPYRRKIQTVFQDPYASLNPRLTVGAIVAEPLLVHAPELRRAEREARVAELLEQVGLPAEVSRRYPHQFSGGQRQRICIARALSSRPDFIVCDECVSALDVSVQAQIVNLLQDLQETLGLAYLFISHDLAVVERISHHVLVMQSGRIVEEGAPEQLYRHPKTEYARQLLDAAPRMPSIARPAP